VQHYNALHYNAHRRQHCDGYVVIE